MTAPGRHTVFVPGGTAKVRRRLAELEEKGGRVHHFDAGDLLTERGIYDTFADVLRFPGYFGSAI